MTTKTRPEALAPEATVEPTPAPIPAPIPVQAKPWGPTHKLVAALGGGFLLLQAVGMVANHAEAKAQPTPPAKHVVHKHHAKAKVAPAPEAKPAPIVVEVRCPAASPTSQPQPKEEPIY